MPSDHRYNVIFSGQITGELGLQDAIARFARTFQLSPERARRYFSGAEITLKREIPRDLAMRYALKLNEIGCDCAIERCKAPAPPAPKKNTNIPGTPGFVERRKANRRVRFRRAPRPGAVCYDRRSGHDRRKS